MGLERIAAIKRGTLSNYDTDVFAPLLEAIANEVGPQDIHDVGDTAPSRQHARSSRTCATWRRR